MHSSLSHDRSSTTAYSKQCFLLNMVYHYTNSLVECIEVYE